MTTLTDLATTLPLPPLTGCWAATGPAIDAFASSPTTLLAFSEVVLPSLDGLLLAGALSTQLPDETEAWLAEVATALPEGATLLVLDWQADGPPTPGPDFDLRFKKGRLLRCLREWGFGQLETLAHRPAIYWVRAVKAPPPPLPTEFVPVTHQSELAKNQMKRVSLHGQAVIVANTGKEIVAFAATCPHASSQLDRGILRGRIVACPLHGYLWNVRTGQPVQPDDEDCLPCYAVRVDPDGQIWVALTPTNA